MRKVNQHGFTIIEVLIASAIFSIVLLAAMAGFMQIGRLFYKGVSIAQTQAIANDILQDVSGNFHTATNVTGQLTGNGYTFLCVGSARYTINRTVKIDQSSPSYPDHSPGGNFGLLKDVPSSSGTACPAPCNDLLIGGVLATCGDTTLRLSNPVELLGNNMRLSNFSITSPTTQSLNLYNISIVIAYGDDDLFDDYTLASPTCKSNSGGQFCAVSQINTLIHRGWRQ